MRIDSNEGKDLETGFSLVEIVVAVGVFAVAILGVFAITGSAVDSVRESGQGYTATQIASDSIERFRGGRPDSSDPVLVEYFGSGWTPMSEENAKDAIYRLELEAFANDDRPEMLTLEARVIYPWLGEARDSQEVLRFSTLLNVSEE